MNFFSKIKCFVAKNIYKFKKIWYHKGGKRSDMDMTNFTTKAMSRNEIRNIADDLLTHFGLRKVPIDIESLCKKIGIVIKEMDFTGIENITGQQVSGAIISNKKSDFSDEYQKKATIFVKETDIPTRKRFTIAHELGHEFLHIKDDADGKIVSFRSLRNEREKQADAFAAELLMPADLVKAEYEKTFFPTSTYLANIFNVSNQAMQYRLQELGLRYIE